MEFCQRIELYQQNKSTLLQSLPFTKREDAENVNVFQLFQTISEENLFNISPVKYLFTCVTCNVYPVKCNVFLWKKNPPNIFRGMDVFLYKSR